MPEIVKWSYPMAAQPEQEFDEEQAWADLAYSELERLGGRVEKARCHSCNDPSKPVAGNRSFEGEGSIAYPVCAECMEGIDAYGEPT